MLLIAKYDSKQASYRQGTTKHESTVPVTEITFSCFCALPVIQSLLELLDAVVVDLTVARCSTLPASCVVLPLAVVLGDKALYSSCLQLVHRRDVPMNTT